MPILPVPYFIQPDGTTCQSTVLKMMAAYIDRKRGQPVQNRGIAEIKHRVNNGAGRPSALLNAWANFRWWLENEFTDMRFLMDTTSDVVQATRIIRGSIQAGYPVLVSTNQNLASSGHIILVVGVMRGAEGQLVEPIPGPVGQNLVFVCHDPYGRFGIQPNQTGSQWGSRRYDMPGGFSAPGGEVGAGMFVPYTLEGIRRSGGTFLLIRAG